MVEGFSSVRGVGRQPSGKGEHKVIILKRGKANSEELVFVADILPSLLPTPHP